MVDPWDTSCVLVVLGIGSVFLSRRKEIGKEGEEEVISRMVHSTDDETTTSSDVGGWWVRGG